jgi:hypothetical protein
MVITQKLGKTELWFFSTALRYNEIYLPTKFHFDNSYVPDKNSGQTDEQTDGQSGNYMLTLWEA